MPGLAQPLHLRLWRELPGGRTSLSSRAWKLKSNLPGLPHPGSQAEWEAVPLPPARARLPGPACLPLCS